MRKAILALASAGSLALAGKTALPASASVATASKYAPVCLPSAVQGVAHCEAIRLNDPAANWKGTHVVVPNKPGHGGGGGGGGGGGTVSTPSGYFPADLQSAYGLGSLSSTTFASGSVPTVAIVDAYNDPNAQADLNVYRKQFSLTYQNSTGSTACTTTNGCLTIVGETGSTTSLPSSNTSWSEEISLDLDMVSAICPNCKILLVEANSATIADLGASVNEAVKLGATVVSNSYGGSEYSSETSSDTSYFYHPGVVITAAAGDGGYGVEYPAASPYVTAVGGTTLTGSSSTGWSQTVWSGSGSGCSKYEPRPAWQPTSGEGSLCPSNRTVADTSADANPSTGVAVYDSYGESGWLVFGGTSVATPLVGSIYALANNESTSLGDAAQSLYGDTSLYTVDSGQNARHCTNYLCNAADSLSGSFGFYNGPTGNGTPQGLTGF